MAVRKRLLRRRLPPMLRYKRALPPAYRPQWGGAFERFASNYVHHNYWRVNNIIESEEDAMAECAYVFAKCADAYKYTVDNDAWFMSLYKRAVNLYWIGLTRKQMRYLDLVYDPDLFLYGNMHPRAVSSAPLNIAIEDAPREVRSFINIILRAPPEVVEYMLELLPDRKAFNARLRRLCHFRGKEFDLLHELEEVVRSD